MDFRQRYSKLNSAQKQAVDTIDGPVMVVAGPGTGKTELLSMRVANILQKTDTSPENILCLTFTESGADAMRGRLTEIIGKEAYKVAIHTFHSFGSEIINQNGEFFYQGASFSPASELSTYKIMRQIFDGLGHNSSLAKKMNDEYTHLKDAINAISEIKKSGFTSDELIAIMDDNDLTIQTVEKELSPIFNSGRPTKGMIDQLTEKIDIIKNIKSNLKTDIIVPLNAIIADSLSEAIDHARELGNKPTPVRIWRDQWFKKDKSNKYVLKSGIYQKKLRDLMPIYDKYLNLMQESSLYDYDDMILRVAQAIDIFPDLRYNLQEKFQYLLVDEFQDTNLAQMRILHTLTNNTSSGDTPNIFVVGDDDQAIFSFQGADISNILNFKSTYPKAKTITLTENYRSTSDILNKSRKVITQGNNRLENILDNLNKNLASNSNSNGHSQIFQLPNIYNERNFIVKKVQELIDEGVPANQITVLTRKHSEILDLLPYFSDAKISVNYERKDNVLENELVRYLVKLSTCLINIARGNHDIVNYQIPEILAHPAWNIDPIDLWHISLNAHKNNQHWLELLENNDKFENIHKWFIKISNIVFETPLEQMLDIIIGKTKPDGMDIDSPIYQYYFSDKILKSDPSSYLIFLNSLRTIREELDDYMPNTSQTLETFVEFIDLNMQAKNQINLIQQIPMFDDAINIMTAHKSKGLEFDSVLIYDAVDSIWGQRARTHNRLINYPENMPFAEAGETYDDRLRLFYVAATRAKRNLYISYSLVNEKGKPTMLSAFLADDDSINKIDATKENSKIIKESELAWYKSISGIESTDINRLLSPLLENYKLSVTHLHNFLDVTRGGPEYFLINNLLHFPQAKNANASFGSAVHNTLQNAHRYVNKNKEKQPIEDILKEFETNLILQRMNKKDFDYYLEKGIDTLRHFLDTKYDSFSDSQIAELDFANQNSIIDQAHIIGKLDLVEIDNNDMSITDYKTGEAFTQWKSNDDRKKIKLHKYKQQLMFYKLLVENSRDFGKYNVDKGAMQFVEPDENDQIQNIQIEFKDNELSEFRRLINCVWKHIKKLDLPDTSHYDPTYKGILQFEQDLLDNII